MAWLNAVLISYAVLLVGGGAMGYSNAGSIVSLVVSAVAAALVLLGVWYAGSNRSMGYLVCLVVAAALGAFFAYRVANGSTMPGIPGLAMSVIVCACLVYAHFNAK